MKNDEQRKGDLGLFVKGINKTFFVKEGEAREVQDDGRGKENNVGGMQADDAALIAGGGVPQNKKIGGKAKKLGLVGFGSTSPQWVRKVAKRKSRKSQVLLMSSSSSSPENLRY